ncbi:MAG: hybrid sensor histidine kinase/response regulator [Candidatus Rokuibacteriota bacterium]
MSSTASGTGPAARLATTLAVAVLYVLAGKLGLSFAFLHVSASPVWPPAGIALAALLLLGYRVWPAVAAGAFLVNVTTAGTVATSAGIALGNTLEALAGAWLVNRLAGGATVFDRVQDILKFLGLAGLASTALAATIGVTSLSLGGHAPWDQYRAIWLTWWLGDAAGVLIVTPLLVLWLRTPGPVELRRRPVEAVLLLASLVAVGLVVFSGTPSALERHPIAYLSIPPLLWAALRLGPAGTSAATVVMCGIAVAGTLQGTGPFARGTPNESLLLLQGFLATVAVTTLAVAVLVRDRRRAGDALRVHEERLRVAVDAARMGTWEWTIATGTVEWSPSLEAMHGLAPGSFAGTYEAFQADVHPDDRAALDQAIRAALERGEHRVEYRIVRPDGVVRWVEGRGKVFRDAAGRPERVIGVCLDVTERRVAEEQRARILERLGFLGEIARSIGASLDLDTVLQRIADGATALCRSDSAAIFLRDGPSGAMVPRYRVGPWLRLYDTLRITPGEGLGGEVMRTGRPLRVERYRDDSRVPRDFHRIADATGTVALMVVPIIIRAEVAGLLYVSNRTARRFTDEDETVCGRLAEQAAIAIQNARLFTGAEAARAQAEAANREKDHFLAMLGHELRNPLGAIGNAAQVLNRLESDDPQAVHARAIIGRQVHHLSRLVDDLLDVSRVMSGKVVLRRQAADLASIVERALTALRPSAGGDRHRLSLHTEPVWVDGDGVRLEQVVTNLVANACKYTPEGGAVDVTLRREGETAVLRVRDSGVGIPPDLVSRVFDLFVQGDHSLDRTGGGLGIGLTLVRRIVELHGGTAEAASDGVGCGSCFTVRLPTTARPDGAAGARPAAPAIASRRVLVVEDNDDSRQMLCELIKLLGREPHEAADGPAGIASALRLEPDLTLIDIGLPGLDGYEVARRIRRHPAGRHLHLVALTGYGMAEDRERALAAGYNGYLVKPVDPVHITTLLD